MEVATLLENKSIGNIYGIIGNIELTTNRSNYGIVTSYRFKETVQAYLHHEKDKKALQMVGLNLNYLEKTGLELSDVDIRKINLAKILIQNKDFIVLDYFEKGMNDREKDNFKRIFKKMAKDYQKTIIIFTNDITYLWDIVDEIILINENITNIPKKEILNNIHLFSKPPIIEFIELLKDKNIPIDYYQDYKDLLKAIYRLKEGV